MYSKPTSWAIGSLTIFVMLAIDAAPSRLSLESLWRPETAPFAVVTGLMLLLAAGCASKTLKAWVQENSEHLLPVLAAFLVVPIVLASASDAFFKLSATSWLFTWGFALMIGLAGEIVALCSGNEIKFSEVAVAALTCYGASVLLWLIFGSLFLIALVLSLVIGACFISLWSKYVPLEEILFDCEDDELDGNVDFTSHFESANDPKPDEDSKPEYTVKEGEAS